MNQETLLSNYLGNLNPPVLPSDLDLVHQIAQRDPNALEELYQRYHLGLFKFLLRTTQEQSNGEDLLQDLFLGVWEGAARFEGRSSVKTWLFRMAHFKAAEWLRNGKVQAKNQEVESFESLPDKGETSLESLVFQHWNFSQIQNAMKQLSPNHCEVIEYMFLHGLTTAETAQIMGCPVGTVKSRLHVALHQLNGILSSKGIKT
jgi:RNA polymerase sigma-70 factor (ECF subfamily)